jgi:hypothetical protein
MSKEQTCKTCWFKKTKGEPMLSDYFKKYETDSCSLEGSPLPKEFTCPSWMSSEGTKGEDK